MRRIAAVAGVCVALVTACTASTKTVATSTPTPTPVVVAPVVAATPRVVPRRPVSNHACTPPTCHIGATHSPRASRSRSYSTPVDKAVGRVMHVTGYCTGQITASGKQVRPGMVAVIDYSIPMGTSVHVEGMTTSVGYWDHDYVVEDHIGHGSQVDIYFDSCAFARKFGAQYLHVTFD